MKPLRNIDLLTFLCLLTIIFLPEVLFAGTVDDKFGAQAISQQTESIKNFLFGPGMRIVGVVGGAFGLFQSIITSSLRPLMLYGGIGLGCSLVPKFIDGVFAANTMLLP